MHENQYGVVLLAASAAFAAEPAVKESPTWVKRDLRIGIIRTGVTPHVPAFAGIMAKHPEWRIKVVAAFKGGNPDMPSSINRVEQFANGLQERYRVEIVDSIEKLIPKVDAIMLQSVDGGQHLEQVTPVLKAGKTVFIDKPLATTVEDARRIVELSKQTGTPFSARRPLRWKHRAAAQQSGRWESPQDRSSREGGTVLRHPFGGSLVWRVRAGMRQRDADQRCRDRQLEGRAFGHPSPGGR